MKKAVKRFKSFSSRGSSLIIVLLLAVVIVASIFFVNGVIPDTTRRPSDTSGVFTLVTPPPGDPHANLQLMTLKFSSCANTAAIGFLLDQSGSMNFGGGSKQANLKNALKYFTSNFPPEGIIGLRTYSSPGFPAHMDVVPFDYFKNNKGDILNTINTMIAKGGTHSKDAFNAIKTDLAVAQAKFPGYKFNLVFISDGIPETLAQNTLCPGGTGSSSTYCTDDPDIGCRCFDPSQDPTSVATEIKATGVRIFTIGYIHDIRDAKFNSTDPSAPASLVNLMKRVASNPDTDFYFAPIDNQLNEILGQISTKICSDVK
ncbi:MAG: vWA domain-containing protein [Patescibacteria group bacterium]